jgi:hypothetical protein
MTAQTRVTNADVLAAITGLTDAITQLVQPQTSVSAPVVETVAATVAAPAPVSSSVSIDEEPPAGFQRRVRYTTPEGKPGDCTVGQFRIRNANSARNGADRHLTIVDVYDTPIKVKEPKAAKSSKKKGVTLEDGSTVNLNSLLASGIWKIKGGWFKFEGNDLAAWKVGQQARDAALDGKALTSENVKAAIDAGVAAYQAHLA